MSGPPPQRSGTRRGAGVKSGAGGAPRGPPTSSSTQERRQDLESLIRSYQIEETGLTDFIGVDADYVTSAAAQTGNEDDGDFQSQANFLEFQRRLALMDDGDSRGLQGEAATFVTFVKGFVGIGILSLPYAMSCGGYIGGPVGLIWRDHQVISAEMVKVKFLGGSSGSHLVAPVAPALLKRWLQ
eukprot:g11768.t1